MVRKSLIKSFLSCLLVALVIFVIKDLKDQIHAMEQLRADSERSLKINCNNDQLVVADSERSLKTNSDQLVAPARKIPYSQEMLEPWALSIEYWEQSACALRNLLDLQCWASSVGINHVVEPVVLPKTYNLLKFSVKVNSTRFRDLFDFDRWNNLSMKLNYSPLAAVEKFLDSAVRQFVYVHIKYDVQPKPCPTKTELADKSWYKGLIMKGFSIIKIVCIDILRMPSHTLTKATFTDTIFHDIGRQVNIIFSEWRGIEPGKMTVNGSNCTSTLGRAISKLSVPYMFPSQKLSDHVDTFIQEHLSGAQYVTVMLRSEKLAKSVRSTPVKSSACIDRILAELEEMLEDQNDMKTLFFSDIGKHGRTTLKDSSALSFSEKLEDTLNPYTSL